MISSDRLDALQSFFPQSDDHVVVFKMSHMTQKVTWFALLILIPTELFLMFALIGLFLERFQLEVWILVILANLALIYLLVHSLRLAFSPNYQMLTLDKEQVTKVSYFKRVKVFRWAGIAKFEIKPAGRSEAIYIQLKSQEKMQSLAFCGYGYAEIEFSELLEILRLWLERYGTPVN